MPNSEYQVVLCTCPNQATAEKLAHLIIDAKLAACVNIIPNLTSIYRWQDKIETSSEQLLIIKTKKSVYTTLESSLIKAHPYECPEIVALSITQGFTGYLQWIDKTVI